MRLTVICQDCEKVATIDLRATKWEKHNSMRYLGSGDFDFVAFWLCPKCSASSNFDKLRNKLQGI